VRSAGCGEGAAGEGCEEGVDCGEGVGDGRHGEGRWLSVEYVVS
jgi:hypothetical protein